MNSTFFKDHFYQLLGLQLLDKDALILGETYPFESPEIALHLLRAWVKKIDIQLERPLEEVSFETKEKLWDIRLFTYEEFQNLFYYTPDPSLYKNRQAAFRFLDITDSLIHQAFTSRYTNDEQGYMALISAYKQLSSCQFFFKKTAMPINQKAIYHSYITGRSGSGKSTLLLKIFTELMAKRNSTLILIEPHGELTDAILKLKSIKAHWDRIVLIDPSLSETKLPCFNPLETDNQNERHIDLLAQEILAVFLELMKDAGLSMPMRSLLLPCLSTLIRAGKASLLELKRFMNDKHNQDLLALGKQSPHEGHRVFFRDEFSNPYFASTKSAISMRIQNLINNSYFLHMTQGKSTIDLREIMAKQKILLLKLPKGIMSDEESSTFGRFIIAQLYSLVLRQGKQDYPTYMFIDECQNFLTSSIEKILSEARKYGLHLVLTHQNIKQIESAKMRDSILSNANFKCIGENSYETFNVLSRNTGIPLADLEQLKPLEFYSKVPNSSAPIRLHISTDIYKDSLSFKEQEDFYQRLVNSKIYRDISQVTYEDNSVSTPDKSPQKIKTSTNKIRQDKVRLQKLGQVKKQVKPKHTFDEE